MAVKTWDLVTDTALKAAIDAVMIEVQKSERSWYPKLRTQLNRAQASQEKLADRAFLEELWEDDSVSATGMGSVKIGKALDDDEFREWFSRAITTPLPADEEQVEAYLTQLYQEIVRRLRDKCDRIARLKLNRVLCARFPDKLTTIADIGSLQFLHRAMSGISGAHPIHAHLAIKRRLDSLLGPVDPATKNGDLDRLCLPWFLCDYVKRESTQSSAGEAESVITASPDGLRPLPAAMRRKGLTSLKGFFGTLLELVPLLQDGLTREEFGDEVRRINPNLGLSGVNSAINTVAREFGLCVFDGILYKLSARGLNLLDTSDPDEFADHLLTRVLGIDYSIKVLEQGSLPAVDLIKELKMVNPGWTTEAIPRAIVSWLESLTLIAKDAGHNYSLTERGNSWASKVTWAPELIPSQTVAMLEPLDTKHRPVSLPSFSMLEDRLNAATAGKLAFPPDLVRQLHAGLWSHPVRHFVVLTGISGSGKTQLAMHYGSALVGAGESGDERVRIIPVQPAWYDPSHLLGYVSPLTQRYCSAPFLDLLLHAADDPERPYVVILDEMNLSHPEQYLAPLLSTMETRGWIDLHDLPEEETGIPQRIRYPANLALIGTLNMDETTHGLSDKVLDRAFTLEFWNIQVEDFPGWSDIALPEGLRDSTKNLLVDLCKALSPVRLHFGWRTIEDVLQYLQFAITAGAEEKKALDAVVYARILPKLRGENTERFHEALSATHLILKKYDLHRSLEKLQTLISDLVHTGTARFWR